MFESLRRNIQSVQDGITAGLQKLSSSSVTTECAGATSTDDECDLLTMYQSQWATMHHMAVQNAKLGQGVASKINGLTSECEFQHGQFLELRSLLAHLPNVMSQLHSSLSTIGKLKSVLEEVDVNLVTLEQLIEESDAQEQILDMKMQYTLKTQDRQTKLNGLRSELLPYCLETCKGQLESKHEEKVQELKSKKAVELKEREKRLTQALESDLENYKTHGIVQKSHLADMTSNLKLEDVDLEDDSNDLEKFLDEDVDLEDDSNDLEKFLDEDHSTS